MIQSIRSLDPRYLQIACLLLFLMAGLSYFAFDLPWTQIAVTMLTVLGVQYGCTRYMRFRGLGGARYDWRSAAISGLSLCLLLRSNSLLWIVSIAAASIGSKFFVRYRGKHVFNPTNFGLAAGTLLSCPVWISPGQWGDAVVFAAAAACLGALVVNRALRSDVTAAFLVSYAALLVWRAVYLGDPWEIPLHQIANGGVIIFAFFMISDPRSTPDSRFGRVLFGVAVAYAAYKIRFTYYTPNALIWSLFFMSPIVPALDGLLKGGRFEWSQCTARAPVKVPV